MQDRFRIGLTAGFRAEAAGRLEPALQQIMGPYPFIEMEFLPKVAVMPPDSLRDLDAVITWRPRFDATSFTGVERLAVIARWGVGYDMIDVEACTAANVVLAITPDAVRKPMAEAILTLVLALAKQLPAKDRLVRAGDWSHKGEIPAYGLAGKTMGSVGLGNIGREMFRLLKPFDLDRFLAYDPYITPVDAAALTVELVDLETVFRESDFVAINCPLNDKTRGMVNAELFGLMKPTAFFINTARGPIVNQADLVSALREGWLAGAGIDVFETEPLPADDPLIGMGNVILTPHALGWVDNLYRDNSLDAVRNVLTMLQGWMPRHAVNCELADKPAFQAKLAALAGRWGRLAADTHR